MKLFQVYEHEIILVGDVRNGILFEQKHFVGLSERLGKKDDFAFPFYSLVKYHQKDGIKFKQYVGAIQVGDLSIEILPKTDRGDEEQNWKDVLLFMLSKVHRLNISSESHTLQNLRSCTILDFIVIRFLNETEKILYQGPINTYNSQDESLHVLKGRLLFQEQISKNNIHKERFYVRHVVYDRSHIMNRILYQTLKCIANSSNNTTSRQRAVAYLSYFPALEKVIVNESLFSHLTFDRKTQGYRDAISLAKLILFNNMPDLSSGRNSTFAMLFDMNRLWEEFVYITLRNHLSEQFTVSAQVKKRFWETKIIKPDIVIRDSSVVNKLYILDTKWKQPDGMYPVDSDLHQLYVYFKYFGAEKVALLYPSTSSISHSVRKGTFYDGSNTSCDLMLLPVPKWNGSGKLWQLEIANMVKAWL